MKRTNSQRKNIKVERIGERERPMKKNKIKRIKREREKKRDIFKICIKKFITRFKWCREGRLGITGDTFKTQAGWEGRKESLQNLKSTSG